MNTLWPGWGVLLAPSSPWLHLLVASEREADIEFMPPPDYWGMQTRVLRGGRCGTKREMLGEWAAALQFPWYFGGNWDAFEECINDLWWTPARAFAFLVTNADQMIHDADDFATFVGILATAASRWADANETENGFPPILSTPFHVVFQCEAERADAFRVRLRAANVLFDTLPALIPYVDDAG